MHRSCPSMRYSELATAESRLNTLCGIYFLYTFSFGISFDTGITRAATSWTTSCHAWNSTRTTWRPWSRKERQITWRRNEKRRIFSTNSCQSKLVEVSPSCYAFVFRLPQCVCVSMGRHIIIRCSSSYYQW